MRNLFAAVLLTTALTAVAHADDTPATTQPAQVEQHIVVMVQHDDGAPPATTQPLQGYRSFSVVRTDDPFARNVAFRTANTHTEKAAWMGVATSHPPLALLKQLKLKSGLVVDQVIAGSPAESAGLKPQDVIEKLDDQILFNPSQLEGLVRMHNPGDSITLTILHEGTRSTLTAKLAEHDVLVTPDAADGVPLQFDAAPAWSTPGVLQLQPGMPPVPAIPAPPGGSSSVYVTPDANAHVEVKTIGQNGQVTTFESQFSDGTTQLTIVRRDNKKILTIKDAQGKQLFEGPVDTAEQQQAIPKDLLPKFQEMQKMANMTDDSPKP